MAWVQSTEAVGLSGFIGPNIAPSIARAMSELVGDKNFTTVPLPRFAAGIQSNGIPLQSVQAVAKPSVPDARHSESPGIT